jgi:hypothetical protein
LMLNVGLLSYLLVSYTTYMNDNLLA